MSHRTRWFIVAAVAGLVFSLGAPAVQAQTAQQQAQAKLLAYRAARVDAIRKLSERINGLMISSETSVRDFVTESDQIETSMRAWLSGMKEVGEPRWMEDGTCEVTMEVTLEELVVRLKQFHKEYYKGNKVKVRDFESLTANVQEKTLSEIGMGAPRVYEPLEASAETSRISGGNVMSLTHLRGEAKAWWLAHVMPQGRLMAVRAARVDAMRRLGERLGGVMIDSQTSVRDFVAESDQINTNMQTFLSGMRETAIRYHDAEPIVEVDLEVTYRTVLTNLKSWGEVHYRGGQVKMKKLEELIVKTRDEVLEETGMGVPPQRYMRDVDAVTVQVAETAMNAPGWVNDTLRATGFGVIEQDRPAGQAKLMAYRAAELDARRKLAEQIEGLMITSETSVRDFVTENDQIETSMLTFQQGAHVVEGSQRVLEDGTAEVTVEIELRPLWNMVLYYQREMSIQVR
jgi:hypothetical protein